MLEVVKSFIMEWYYYFIGCRFISRQLPSEIMRDISLFFREEECEELVFASGFFAEMIVPLGEKYTWAFNVCFCRNLRILNFFKDFFKFSLKRVTM